MPTIAEKLETIAENEQKVYDKGAKSEYDMFWDNYQSNGTRMAYTYGFAGEGWDENTFYPKYDIVISTGQDCFSYFKVTDLKQRLIDCGVKLLFTATETTGLASLYRLFYNSHTVVKIPALIAPKCTNAQNTFNGCKKLTHIDEIVLAEDCKLESMFSNCIALEYIRWGYTIGYSLNMQSCSNLSIDSAKDTIFHLKNFIGTDQEYVNKLTLISAVWTNLNNTETPPSGNTWQEYVSSLGWQYA